MTKKELKIIIDYISNKYDIPIDFLEKELNDISKDKWLYLLQNEKTDYAANLLLYNLYQKGAILFYNQDKFYWRSCCKSDDINYWKQFL